MKQIVIITALILAIPFLLPAQIKTIQQVKSQPQKAQQPVSNLKQRTLQLPGGKLPVFKIKSAAELRNEIGKFTPIPVGTPVSEDKEHVNAGNAAYKSSNGVLLNSKIVMDPVTNSSLQLSDVFYDERLVSQLKGNSAPSVWQYVKPAAINFKHIEAIFRDVSTTTHTYLLTLGTSAPLANTRIKVSNGDLTEFMEFDQNKLIAVPGTSEIRLLFTYKAKYIEPGYLMSGYPLYIEVIYTPINGFIVFNHIQLVQLD